MKTLYQLFDEAVDFARIRNGYITIQRKNGDRSVYFLVCSTVNEEDPTQITGFGICCFGDDPDSSKSFSFDLPPYKRMAFSHLGIDCEDIDWEIDQEDLWKVKYKLEAIQEKLEAHL